MSYFQGSTSPTSASTSCRNSKAEARSPVPLPAADQFLLRRDQGGQSLESGPRRRPGADRGVPLHVGPLKFARELLCLNSANKPKAGDCEGGLHFDIFDVHPYTTGGRPTGRPQRRRAGRPGEAQAVLRRPTAPAGSTATTSTRRSGPPSSPGTPSRRTRGPADEDRGRWIDEALYRAWKAGVEDFFWFGLRDEPLEHGIPLRERPVGALLQWRHRRRDRPKRMFYAFRFPFVAYPEGKGMKIWGRTPRQPARQGQDPALRGGKWRDAGLAGRRTGCSGATRDRLRRREEGPPEHVSKFASVPFSMRPVPDFFQPPFAAEPGRSGPAKTADPGFRCRARR